MVGIAALLTVTKYEEIYPPLLKDFVFISDNTYTAEEILEMEKRILFTLDFDLSLTTAYRFLERFSKLAKLDKISFFLSQYMLELGLLDSKMTQFKQSLQAVAAIYMAKKFLDINNPSNFDFATVLSDLNVHYTLDQIKSCAKCFNQLASLI